MGNKCDVVGDTEQSVEDFLDTVVLWLLDNACRFCIPHLFLCFYFIPVADAYTFTAVCDFVLPHSLQSAIVCRCIPS